MRRLMQSEGCIKMRPLKEAAQSDSKGRTESLPEAPRKGSLWPGREETVTLRRQSPIQAALLSPHERCGSSRGEGRLLKSVPTLN